jgi:Cupin-like domain
MSTIRPIREWQNVDRALFMAEIAPLAKPAVLRGLVRDWPSVGEGLKSPNALWSYVRRFDCGAPVDASIGAPSIRGRFFYREDMRGLNFEHRKDPLTTVIERLLSYLANESAPSIYVQAASLPECLPGFASENYLDIWDRNVVPRIWIGNKVQVAAHYDLSENVACVVCGRRRFTLFPPEQISKLYVGPFDFTLAGTPVSMVSLDEPDLQRYPRFAEALAAAETADLEPGDALYIPYLWWHAVKSLEPFNVLVNYWWNDARATASPHHALMMASLALQGLSDSQRAVWRAFFDHYIFRVHGDPLAHIPPEHHGTLGDLTPEQMHQLKIMLSNALRS